MKQYTERIEVRITKKQLKEIKKFAINNDLNINQLIRKAIKELIGD